MSAIAECCASVAQSKIDSRQSQIYRRRPGSRPALSAVTPSEGRDERSGASGAWIHLSANFAACLNIPTNIFRVSLPVCVFWFEGW